MSANCAKCGAAFEKTLPWKIYCSAKCRNTNAAKKARTQAFQRNRRDFINSVKMALGCAMCGYNKHPAALEFNHIRGVKDFCISQDPKVAMQRLQEEIAKCEVLCANCHRIHTYENRHWHTKRKGAGYVVA